MFIVYTDRASYPVGVVADEIARQIAELADFSQSTGWNSRLHDVSKLTGGIKAAKCSLKQLYENIQSIIDTSTLLCKINYPTRIDLTSFGSNWARYLRGSQARPSVQVIRIDNDSTKQTRLIGLQYIEAT